MLTLLSSFFIKNREDTGDPSVRQAYGVLCGALGIFLNLLLFAGKALAGFLSGSVAITADAFNNLSDAGSSIITLIGFRMSGQEPDPGHPFGHGRIEYLSGLVVSGIILLMASELLKSSVQKILHPEALSFSPVVVAILLGSILVKLYMYAYNRSVAKKIDSSAMMATATDSISDTLATTVVLLATLAGHFWGLHIDGWCGVLVGLFIAWAGINAARDTISPLLGQPPKKEFVDQIEQLVLSCPDVRGIHDLIVHDYGPGRVMISLHAEVPAEGDILELHDSIDNIERLLQKQLRCSATIHMDPVITQDEAVLALRDEVNGIVRGIDSALGMHDFRVVTGPTHTNLIFDIQAPYHFRLDDDQLRDLVSEEIRKKHDSFYTIIQIDKIYS